MFALYNVYIYITLRLRNDKCLNKSKWEDLFLLPTPFKNKYPGDNKTPVVFILLFMKHKHQETL